MPQLLVSGFQEEPRPDLSVNDGKHRLLGSHTLLWEEWGNGFCKVSKTDTVTWLSCITTRIFLVAKVDSLHFQAKNVHLKPTKLICRLCKKHPYPFTVPIEVRVPRIQPYTRQQYAAYQGFFYGNGGGRGHYLLHLPLDN